MEVPGVINKIPELSDLELATLLCLIAKEHCIISTDNDVIDALEQELQLVASSVFGLSSAVICCTDNTTVDDFTDALLVNGKTSDQSSVLPSGDAVNALDPDVPELAKVSPLESPSRSSWPNINLNHETISNVIIARDINLAKSVVQIQALELIRSGHISVGTTVYNVPEPFLVIFLLSSSGPRPIKHLNDRVFISHYHDPGDGFPNLEDNIDWYADDRASMSSVVHKSKDKNTQESYSRCVISHTDLNTLIRHSHSVTITAEVKRYLQNIVVFLRLHRAVAGGISARATKHFDLLVKCLAPLHSLNYVTPSLVALAARKVYPHRLSITSPRNERSMQYGSELAAVTTMLESITPELVIEEVLTAVEVPL